MSSQVPHIRIYKAAAHHPLFWWIFHQKYEIPYLSWYSLRQQCTGTDVMLLEKSNSWDVQDLCIIVLLDSEVNHPYKRIGRYAMRAAKKHGQIDPEQYSRTQCSAVSHGINCRLAFDHQLYLQQPFYLACSDLKSCYDLIFHYTSRRVLQLLGIPLLELISILDTIQRMSHIVSMSYGD